jgi:hypothetical protein
MLMEWRRKDVLGLYRKVDDGPDADSARIRSIAIREDQETMERGVGERDNPPDFLP